MRNCTIKEVRKPFTSSLNSIAPNKIIDYQLRLYTEDFAGSFEELTCILLRQKNSILRYEKC